MKISLIRSNDFSKLAWLEINIVAKQRINRESIKCGKSWGYCIKKENNCEHYNQ